MKRSRLIGISLVFFGVVLLILIYAPIIINYAGYYFGGGSDEDVNKQIVELLDEQEMVIEEEKEDRIEQIADIFPDTDFGIVIPKINSKAKVIPDVDPFNEPEYTEALKDGIAHAQGTSKPGEPGNTFLFAHSAMNFYDLTSQNVNFYLLTKMEQGDSIYTVFDGHVYEHKVESVEIVDPTEIEYITKSVEDDTLTLMTCWPAGTDYKRVVVTSVATEPSE